MVGSLGLLADIKLGWKQLIEANNLAY
jgi:hypothetical protein